MTLKFYHWIGTDAGPVVAEINKRFHAENPNITVQFSSNSSDQVAKEIHAASFSSRTIQTCPSDAQDWKP
ncbi:hypothetical protein KSD_54690 [Ktedonobacter sp. SOSP1-85]|nr:hypothetical protein KSD_54690 [Ktedonobacter sp. SOSP1-85]